MKNIVFIVLIFIATGCVTQRRCEQKFPPVQSTQIRDSVVITEETRYFDTIIFKTVEIPRYTVRDSVLIVYKNGAAVTVKPLKLQGRYSVSLVWLQNNVLKGELTESGWIPLQAKISLQEKTIKELQQKQTVKTVIKTQKYIPAIVKFFAWIGAVSLLLFIAYIVIKVLKPKWL